ncbi:MAG: cation diffusion facilitator family transporter [Lachnospiraceae bacterium]|nr:cation diffusion facilitator family transporter [Lachnospiraceae bacterium]
MIQFLVKRFVPDYENVADPGVRSRYGTLGGMVGIVCNVFLFLVKFVAGLAAGSVSVMADAFNNLSDAGSSVVTLIGFHMAGKPADPDHPFGHGRIEYLSGLFVSAVILLMGVELLKSSVEKIIHPQAIEVTLFSVCVLILAILLKFWMAHFNRTLGNRISSDAMKATATDSMSDCLATTAVLLGMIFCYFTNRNIDGYVGVLVSVFVLKAGFESAKDTVQPLLGTVPDPELVSAMEKYVMESNMVLGIHDMIVHDYGPGRLMVSLHAEVDSTNNVLDIHEEIDRIERGMNKKFMCETTIHMDPVVVYDDMINIAKAEVKRIIESMNPEWKFHDFRMVKGQKNSNLIFDLVIPADQMVRAGEIGRQVTEKIHLEHPEYTAVIKVEQSFV